MIINLKKHFLDAMFTFNENSMLKVTLDFGNNALISDEDFLVDPTISFMWRRKFPQYLPLRKFLFSHPKSPNSWAHPNSTIGTHISNANQKISFPHYFTYSNLVKCGIDSTYHKCSY